MGAVPAKGKRKAKAPVTLSPDRSGKAYSLYTIDSTMFTSSSAAGHDAPAGAQLSIPAVYGTPSSTCGLTFCCLCGIVAEAYRGPFEAYVMVYGPGGCGKSAFVVQYIQANFMCGLFFFFVFSDFLFSRLRSNYWRHVCFVKKYFPENNVPDLVTGNN